MSDTVQGPAPLEGIRVLEMSGPIGAYCGRILADLGADVVLVEPPEGDPLRRTPPFHADHSTASLVFAYYHASKRSIVLRPGDEQLLAGIGRGADVVVHSPSSPMPVPGWDPETLSFAWAPQAVVCSITPFGVTGPHAWWHSTPFVSFAMGGNMIRAGRPEGPPLAMPGRQLWDEAGIHAAICILAALGIGDWISPQGIDLSVHEVAAVRDFFIEQYDVVGMSTLGRRVTVGYPPTGTYQCADGPFDVAAHQLRHWTAFCEMLDHPQELAEPSLADPLVRRERFEELTKTIQDLVRERSRQELVERGQAVGLPCGMLHLPTEFVSDRQLVARDALTEAPTPTGFVRMPAPGAGFFTTPPITVRRKSAPAKPGVDQVSWDPRPLGPVASDSTPLLHRVKVLSFGAFVAGNTTASLLAQLGADVVKIEARRRPEVLRTPAYAIGATATEPSGVTNTVMYASLSRSVRSLSIDVETPSGHDLFRRLVAVADVVIENFGASTVERLGLSFDQLRALNPQIVLTSLSGYGRSGPRRSYLAYATNISNFVGLTYAWGHRHGTHSDYVTAEHAVLGTLAALRWVALTGHGVWVDAAQTEAMAAIMPDIVLEATVNGRDVEPSNNHVPGALISGVYRCIGNDAWLAVEVGSLAEWADLTNLLDLPVEAKSPLEAEVLRPVIDAALQGWAGERTPMSAARELQRNGIAAGLVQSSEDLWRDPQLWSRNFPVASLQPDLGMLHYGDSPHRLRRTPGRIGHVGRRLGQDTEAVLSEWLGLSSSELKAAMLDGSVFQA